MARTNIENTATNVIPPPSPPEDTISIDDGFRFAKDGPPIPGVFAIWQQMIVPICTTDMIMNSFIPFALFFLRTGIPAKLAIPTKMTAAVTAKYMDAS